MEIELTADGSLTLFVPELDEHYHSTKGAVTESQHVFLHMGWEQCTAPEPRVLEVGFGTGLNAFLTLLAAEREQRRTHYTAIELHPLDEQLAGKLGYARLTAPEREEAFRALHRAEWEKECGITPAFTLRKVQADFTQGVPEGPYDLIYFDAFAPEKQPEMWTQTLFERLCAQLSPGGLLVTYCAKGAVRRMLQAAGFRTERLPGPPNGKREILRGTKI